jgi:hypothetical protein
VGPGPIERSTFPLHLRNTGKPSAAGFLLHVAGGRLHAASATHNSPHHPDDFTRGRYWRGDMSLCRHVHASSVPFCPISGHKSYACHTASKAGYSPPYCHLPPSYYPSFYASHLKFGADLATLILLLSLPNRAQ